MSADDFKTVRGGLTQDPHPVPLATALAALDRIEAWVEEHPYSGLDVDMAVEGAQASAAAMREALLLACDRQSESWRAWTHEEGCRAVHDEDAEDACDGRFIAEKVAAALATDAGRAKLDELENAHASCRIERARAEKAEAERDDARHLLEQLIVVLDGGVPSPVAAATMLGTRMQVLVRERDALHAFEANVRELLAKASTPGKGPTHHCAHCLASFDGPEATNEHARACPRSPVARENVALRAEVERLRARTASAVVDGDVCVLHPDELSERIAQARREERERCARRVDEMHDSLAQAGEGEAMNRMAGYAAKAIRALGDA